MKQVTQRQRSLKSYVDGLQARGYYSFIRGDAQKVLEVTDTAFRFSANRLSKKGRIASPRRGFYVIVPAEYQLAGAPPATWFIDELMKFHGLPYYVGLLSAAALHGAAHQQPQEFQVIASSPLRPIRIGRERVKFFTKKQMGRTPTEMKKGATGFFPVSTPEATALDLIRYSRSAGHLSHVATVLNELREKMASDRLIEAAKIEGDLASAQRLGYLLDYLKDKKLSEPLYKWAKRGNLLPVPLIPVRKLPEKRTYNPKWAIVINEDIEMDR